MRFVAKTQFLRGNDVASYISTRTKIDINQNTVRYQRGHSFISTRTQLYINQDRVTYQPGHSYISTRTQLDIKQDRVTVGYQPRHS